MVRQNCQIIFYLIFCFVLPITRTVTFALHIKMLIAIITEIFNKCILSNDTFCMRLDPFNWQNPAENYAVFVVV